MDHLRLLEVCPYFSFEIPNRSTRNHTIVHFAEKSVKRSASCPSRGWLRDPVVLPTSWTALDALHPQLAQTDDTLRWCVRALVRATLDSRQQDRHGNFDVLWHLLQVLQELGVCDRCQAGLEVRGWRRMGEDHDVLEMLEPMIRRYSSFASRTFP